MGRQVQRRLALLGIVGTVSAGWMVALESPSVIPAAAASAGSASSAPVVRVAACPFPKELRKGFESASRDAKIPAAMLYAVAKVESNLHQGAESSAGARGVLQVMPLTGKSLNLDIDDTDSNILAGARYLRQMLDRFGSSDLALAAYNAGPTAVAMSGGAPSMDVERYVANVNTQWHSVAGCR
ncbi:MAG TPA: lytic transglycosylase domain-containing protein [Gaiellaceae bacterium]|jgi:soluble lytic murein transglycosylase-like protein|nr:lytic transglycosylase domain-containing protein [Gaiellaceae bacterium]